MRKLMIAMCASALLVLCVVTFTTAGEKSGKAAAQLGAPAPQFALQDQNGKTVNLSDYSGKVVVLEWFNDGCPFVQAHYKGESDMNASASKLADKGIVWLAINSTKDANVEHNKQIAAEWKIDRPILDDSSGNVGHLYGAKTTPHMYVIDKDGKLAYMGAIDNNPNGDKKDNKINYVEKAVNEILAGSSVSEPQTKSYGCSVKYGK
jgi:peroxiredoxin